jgi:hypothetical protein
MYWRDVNKEPPPANTELIVFSEDFRDTMCKGIFYKWRYRDNLPANLCGWWSENHMGFTQNITHWAPTPDQPERPKYAD